MEIRDLEDVEMLNKREFIHFENDYHRELYLSNNPQIKVAHNCCGGKGIAIEKKTPIRIKPKQSIGIKGTCDICFMEGVVSIRLSPRSLPIAVEHCVTMINSYLEN